MPLTSASLFEDVVMKLSVLRYIIKSRSKQQYFDLNKQAENFIKDILNLVYGYGLVNLNVDNKNTAAIDLGSLEDSIAVQVTATDTADKIHKSIAGFIKGKLYEKYDRLIVFIITGKKDYTAEFKTNDLFEFDPGSDVLDIDDLLDEINHLPLDKLQAIHSFISAELAPIAQALAPPDSLLFKAEKVEEKPFKNAKRFRLALGLNFDDDWRADIKKLRKFYDELIGFSRKQREFIAFIVFKGKPISQGFYERVGIFPQELQKLLRLSVEEMREYYVVLDHARLISYDEDEYGSQFELTRQMVGGEDLFLCLKKFLKTKELVDQLFVDCDFTLLD